MRKIQLAAVSESCNNSGMDGNITTRLLTQYNSAVYDAGDYAKEHRLSNRDAVKARLAARKRLADEKSREQAVNDELHRIIKAMVTLIT